jgi:hypothetical protein
MVSSIAYYFIFGKPVIFYLGILTFLSFCFTASISILFRRGISYVPFKWHPRMAFISLSLAAIHGFLAISIYFRF